RPRPRRATATPTAAAATPPAASPHRPPAVYRAAPADPTPPTAIPVTGSTPTGVPLPGLPVAEVSALPVVSVPGAGSEAGTGTAPDSSGVLPSASPVAGSSVTGLPLPAMSDRPLGAQQLVQRVGLLHADPQAAAELVDAHARLVDLAGAFQQLLVRHALAGFERGHVRRLLRHHLGLGLGDGGGRGRGGRLHRRHRGRGRGGEFPSRH